MTNTRISTYRADVHGYVRLFVSDCADCGVIFGITEDLEGRRRDDHGTFYCPNGHSMTFTDLSAAEKEAKRQRERADHLSTRLLAEMDQARAAELEAAKARASEIRLRWRIGNGVCPCCNRTFQELARHVISKHPEFVHQDLETLSTRMRETLLTLRRATEEQDAAVVDPHEIGANANTLRALERRGLVDVADWEHVALTEAGWPVAEQIAKADA